MYALTLFNRQANKRNYETMILFNILLLFLDQCLQIGFANLAISLNNSFAISNQWKHQFYDVCIIINGTG